MGQSSKRPLTTRAELDVTGLLRAWSEGDPQAFEKLFPLLYDDLRREAARRLRRERRDHTLRPTVLVHEAYLRLVGQAAAAWHNRSQFFAVAAQVMRRVLVDYARRRAAAKRAGSWRRISLAGVDAAQKPRDVDLLALDHALQELSAADPDKARLVELRFFGGLSIEETAKVLDVSPATVTREWRLARAWLYRRLKVSPA